MITRINNITVLLFTAITWLAFQACSPTKAMDAWDDALPHSGQSIFDQISHQDMVELTLVTDLDSLIQRRYNDDYRSATVSFDDALGSFNTFQAKVKPRGKFRRKVCEFPPIKIKFSKKELEAAGFSEMNELKLVTHCLSNRSASKELILREYLIYKMYNELTPNSLRVQLAKITYRDAKDPNYKIKRWGFLIEDEEEFSERVGGTVCDCMGKSPEEIDPVHERIASLFQYMVGNTDWDLRMARNVKFVTIGNSKLIPVPYDFDFSAMVSAPYARPNMDVGQKSLRERVFMGHASNKDELYSTLSYFKSKKEKLLSVVANFHHLDNGSRAAITEYLNGFFSALENEEVEQQLFARNF